MTKILVSDDSAFMRSIITNTLREAQYTDIVEAEDGEEAIALYRSEKPDIVLLDINMPKLDGLSVLETIAPEGATVIMISAIGQQKFIDKALETGAKDFFIKPYAIKTDLVSKINCLSNEPSHD
ncbi:MAG TPA: response regulator [bacterium]|nr:response regulator [bacterium]